MNHTKQTETEPTHIVLTVEDENREPEELFRGSLRECQSYIDRTGLITLEIKTI